MILNSRPHVGDPLKISVYFEYPLYLSGMHQVSNKLVYNDERFHQLKLWTPVTQPVDFKVV